MLEIGNYKAKIVGCFTGESPEKNTPYFGIEFETIGEKPQSIDWVAYLSEKEFTKKSGEISTMAKENIQTLLKLGFCGRTISDLSNNEKQITELFNTVENISITVEHEEYTNDAGEIKKIAKVKFVNVGSSVSKFDHKQAVAKFKSYSFDSDLMKLKKTVGTTKKKDETKAEETIPAQDSAFLSEDIPF